MVVNFSYIRRQIARLGSFRQWASKIETTLLEKVIDDGEQILAMTAGLWEERRWLLVITDRRILFLKKGFLNDLWHQIPLIEIVSWTSRTGLLFGSITLTARRGVIRIDSIMKRDVTNIDSVLSELISERFE